MPDKNFRQYFEALAPFAIVTVRECDAYLLQFDQLIADFEAEINLAKTKAMHEGVYSSSEHWSEINRRLKNAKAIRQGVQVRRGELNREERKAYQKRIEYAFMDAAKAVLDRETLSHIWDKVHHDHPELAV